MWILSVEDINPSPIWQALLKQLSVHYASDSPISDESDIQCRNQLKKLYTSTRTAKVQIYIDSDFVINVEGDTT